MFVYFMRILLLTLRPIYHGMGLFIQQLSTNVTPDIELGAVQEKKCKQL